MLLNFLQSLHLDAVQQRMVKAVEGALWVAVSGAIMAGAHFIVGNGLVDGASILKVMGGTFVAALINALIQLEGSLVSDVSAATAVVPPSAPAAPPPPPVVSDPTSKG